MKLNFNRAFLLLNYINKYVVNPSKDRFSDIKSIKFVNSTATEMHKCVINSIPIAEISTNDDNKKAIALKAS